MVVTMVESKRAMIGEFRCLMFDVPCSIFDVWYSMPWCPVRVPWPFLALSIAGGTKRSLTKKIGGTLPPIKRLYPSPHTYFHSTIYHSTIYPAPASDKRQVTSSDQQWPGDKRQERDKRPEWRRRRKSQKSRVCLLGPTRLNTSRTIVVESNPSRFDQLMAGKENDNEWWITAPDSHSPRSQGNNHLITVAETVKGRHVKNAKCKMQNLKSKI